MKRGQVLLEVVLVVVAVVMLIGIAVFLHGKKSQQSPAHLAAEHRAVAARNYRE